MAQRPAHASYEEKTKREIWARAVEAATKRGFDLGFADPSLGVLVTKEREGQAQCGETACLAREALYLRLENGHAVANLSRTTWDPTLRSWSPPADPAGIRALEKEQMVILKEIADSDFEVRVSRKGEPCNAGSECEKGLICVRRKCAEPEQ